MIFRDLSVGDYFKKLPNGDLYQKNTDARATNLSKISDDSFYGFKNNGPIRDRSETIDETLEVVIVEAKSNSSAWQSLSGIEIK